MKNHRSVTLSLLWLGATSVLAAGQLDGPDLGPIPQAWVVHESATAPSAPLRQVRREQLRERLAGQGLMARAAETPGAILGSDAEPSDLVLGEAAQLAPTSCVVPATPAASCPTYRTVLQVGPGRSYASISAALAAAPTGGAQIDVYPNGFSTYDESLVVSKKVSIIGRNSASQEHDVRLRTSATGHGVRITVDDVCIQGLRIDHQAPTSAVYLEGSGTNTLDRVKLLNNVVDVSLSTATTGVDGIELRGTNLCTLWNNLIVGNNDAIGIHLESDLGHSSDVIHSNTISGFDWGILLNAGTFYSYNRSMSNNLIAFNNVLRCANGMGSIAMQIGTFTARINDTSYYQNVVSEPLGYYGYGILLDGSLKDRVCGAKVTGFTIGVGVTGSFGVASSENLVRDSVIRAPKWAIGVGASSGHLFANNNLSTENTGGVNNYAGIAFVASGGSHTITQGEQHNNDCNILRDGAPYPSLTRPILYDSVFSTFDICTR